MYSLRLKSWGSVKPEFAGSALRALFVLDTGILRDDVLDTGSELVPVYIELLE
jgi:hypothetical protein